MRARNWIIVAALTVTFPAIGWAQERANPGSTTSPPTTQTPPTTQPTPAPQPTTTTDNTSSRWYQTTPSHWVASGFVGSNFGASADSASVDFGGQIGYLWGGVVGAELLGDFAPKFKLNNALLADNPMVNAYMLNAIGAVPLGADGQFQPYISGGFGGIQLRSDVLSTSATTTSNAARAGADIGVGIMGFAGNVGVRGDVRYYRAFTNTSIGTGDNAIAEGMLSGLNFWRANVGVAVRW